MVRDAVDTTVTSRFADVVYADPAWVDAEFDAIIQAAFAPPPTRPQAWSGPGRSPRGAAAEDTFPTSPAKLPAPRRCPRRERSPPCAWGVSARH